MASPALGAVEVQKDAGSRTWYCGQIVDIARDKAVVAFAGSDGAEPAGDAWKRQQFPLSSVRKPPKPQQSDLDKFNPQIGDEVELRVDATEHAPASWAHAVLKNIKSNSFYFVTRTSAVGGSAEAIVEKDMLRPVSSSTGLSGGSVKQETFDMKPELHSWMSTPDAAGCFSHIEDLSGLLFVQALDKKLMLVGDAKAIARARMLLEVHVKHQAEIQRFQETREKRLKALESKRSRIQGTGFKHSIEVKVDPAYIRRIIGRGGEAIKSLEEKYGVSVRIADEEDPEERTVRIFGNSTEDLDRARTEVEFVEELLSVDPEMYSWILGKKGATIQAFRDACNLVYASLDRDRQSLRICGTRQAVQDALAMFESHLMYFPVVRQMDEEMEAILGQLEEYGDWNARWEWGWYRDDEPEEQWGGGWSGKKGGQSQGGWSEWKEWNEDSGGGKGGSWSGGQRSSSKGEKSKGKGSKAKARGWEEPEEEEEEEAWEEEKPPTREKGRGKGSKGKTSGGRSYQPKDKSQEEPEAAAEDRGGRGRGKGGRGRGARGAAEAAAPSPPERPPPGERKRGKNGPRT